ncbi:MAG: hypothetical protein GTO51_06235 [Candidatus Latescibacteria bacterium]|nr:hypothetical protein [Candidatus Latescibacterota bacterium]NIM21389.1 hypothetical protein [Candidatus Latescibacterota bacterium]NIM65570.1 hypothetical protein [Candidatus Latescibacterota bacterium]NIO01950.1 hypothetical protein [Candidatus Latescibacterota bacterium]NIO28763.1 hypothetical protein [Candidatus Latescibacterota bacterium]
MIEKACGRAFAVCLLSALLIIPCAGLAGTQAISFTLDGMGSFLENPVLFEGMINSNPDLTPGWFMIEIDDTGWPPETDKTARWNHIVTNFFTYDATPGGEHWDGYFPAQGSQFPVVTWHFSSSGNRLGGIIRYLIITIYDSDKDGVIDQDELANQAVAGNLHVHIEQSDGVYFGWCSIGSMNGTLANFDPGLPDILAIYSGSLNLRDFSCAVPVEQRTWGAVKMIYSE